MSVWGTIRNGGLASIIVDITLQRQLFGGQNPWHNAGMGAIRESPLIGVMPESHFYKTNPLDSRYHCAGSL